MAVPAETRRQPVRTRTREEIIEEALVETGLTSEAITEVCRHLRQARGEGDNQPRPRLVQPEK